MTTFKDLLTQHVGAAFAKQLAFADFLGERNWSVDIQQGVCEFGDDLRFPIQLLGTEADGDSTWLWAWANEESNLPPAVLRACNYLRDNGEKNGMQEFAEPTFPLEVASGHAIALIASGISANCCYYRGPYAGGALFFLVSEVPESILRPVDMPRMVTVVTEVISQFEVDHRQMVEAFLRSQAFEIGSAEGKITGKRNAETMEFSFGDRGLLSKYETVVGPSSPPRKSWQFWKS